MKAMLIGLTALGLAGTSALPAQEEAGARKTLRVGTYRSRAVVLAYVRSDRHDRALRKLMEAHERAEKDGDAATAATIEKKADAAQKRVHMQGFGNAPIPDILAQIEDEVARVAREAQVDLVVRDVDIAFRGDDVELVDLPAALVEIFDPSPETLRVIEEMSRHPPIPLESFPIEHDGHGEPDDADEAEPAPTGAVDEASAAAREWLALIDAGTFERSWEGASEHFRAVVPRESWLESMSTLRGSTGKVLSREVESARYTTRVPDGPAGAYVLLRFRTAFEGGRKVTETVSMVREVRGVWAADGYYIR